MLLQELSDLEQLTVEEPNCLTNHPSYNHWVQRCETIYQQVKEHNPKFLHRPYQPHYAALYNLRRRGLMAYSMSAGKTLITALHIASLYGDLAEGRAGRVHILVPNGLAARRWLEDLEAVPQLQGLVTYISQPKDLKNATPILIYNHDFPKRAYRQWRARRNSCARYLKHYLRPSLTVIDEVHACANSNTQRVKAIAYLLRYSKRALGVTGTLSDGRLEMVDSLCRLIYGRHWPYPTRKLFLAAFAERKAVEGNYLDGESPEGNRYLDHLDWDTAPRYYETCRRFSHRVTLNDPDVADWIVIPKMETHSHLVDLIPELREDYDRYVQEHRQMMEILAESTDASYRMKALGLIHPLINLCNSPTDESDHLKVTNKAALSLELIGKKKGKTAVFCQHVASARYLARYYRLFLGDENVVRLYANDPKETPATLNFDQRAAALEEFQYGKAKVGIFSVNLAAESIDLTSAEQVIFYCLPWSSLKIQQAVYRAVRPGNRHESVDIHFLAHRHAIDQYQMQLAETKIRLSQQLVDYEDLGEAVYDEAPRLGDLNPVDVLKSLLAGV